MRPGSAVSTVPFMKRWGSNRDTAASGLVRAAFKKRRKRATAAFGIQASGCAQGMHLQQTQERFIMVWTEALTEGACKAGGSEEMR